MEKIKKCKFCQMDIPKKAKVCPNCKRNLNSGGGCLSVIIVFVLILGFAVIMVSNYAGKTTSEDGSQQEGQTQKDVEIEVGQTGKISDGLNLVVNEVSETESISAANGMMSYKPDSGKYAIVNVTISNTSKTSESMLLNYFRLIGPDDAKYVATIIAVADEKFITVDTINPNLDITGNLVFEIPKDLAAEDCILQYSDYDLLNEISYFNLK